MDGRTVLVVGATGNQGGATARRLLAEGWRVHALTRDTSTDLSMALAEQGADLVEGNLDDRGSLDAAVKDVHGVFSVQPGALASPAVPYDDEIRWGMNIADAVRRGRRESTVTVQAIRSR